MGRLCIESPEAISSSTISSSFSHPDNSVITTPTNQPGERRLRGALFISLKEIDRKCESWRYLGHGCKNRPLSVSRSGKRWRACRRRPTVRSSWGVAPPPRAAVAKDPADPLDASRTRRALAFTRTFDGSLSWPPRMDVPWPN